MTSRQTECLLGVAALRRSRNKGQLEISEDPGYQERSTQDLISAHLLGLNTATHEDLPGAWPERRTVHDGGGGRRKKVTHELHANRKLQKVVLLSEKIAALF
jgi:hypothetical protein